MGIVRYLLQLSILFSLLKWLVWPNQVNKIDDSMKEWFDNEMHRNLNETELLRFQNTQNHQESLKNIMSDRKSYIKRHIDSKKKEKREEEKKVAKEQAERVKAYMEKKIKGKKT